MKKEEIKFKEYQKKKGDNDNNDNNDNNNDNDDGITGGDENMLLEG